MIKITDKTMCTGCGVCKSVCPTMAIELIEDDEGFLYPKIRNDLCIECRKCELLCHMHQETRRNSIKSSYYAAYLKDTTLLEQVSSGGAFWALAEIILKQQGVVFGAVQGGIFDVHHERAETLEAAKQFRRSKYLQSVVGDCYQQAKEDLNIGRLVLFSGTACQIQALYSFLNKNYDNLITCDVVCHGVPSIKAFHYYIDEMEQKHKTTIVNLIYRDKSYGWSNNHIAFTCSNGKVIKKPSGTHLFHAGYLQGLFNRPACGSCRYASIPRISDITLADYWQYSGELIKKNADRGISLIVCSTEKGKDLLMHAQQLLYLDLTTEKAALASCRHLTHHPIESPYRNKFFLLLTHFGYSNTIRQCMGQRTKKDKIHLFLYTIKLFFIKLKNI